LGDFLPLGRLLEIVGDIKEIKSPQNGNFWAILGMKKITEKF
jgi:hypothetical protein